MNGVPKILIVDDEEALREAIAFDFRRKKFHVLTAASGREAMRSVENESIDVILSDVRMPDGDGIELLDFIRARNSVLPVMMFITGHADITLEDAYDLGVNAVFAKPFDRKLLMNTVLNAIQPFEQRLQRKSSRLEGHFATGLLFKDSGRDAQSRVSAIGRGGICVRLESVVPRVSETAEFRLETKQEPRVVLDGQGVVRWVRANGNGHGGCDCGIEFLGLDQQCLGQLLTLLDDLQTRSFIPKN